MEDSYEKRKTLQELTIKDNFLFGAVMVNEENCKEFLEMVLEIEIDQVKVSKEKSIVYHPEYKGVRLDVYARDTEHTHYNIEMQAENSTAEYPREKLRRSSGKTGNVSEICQSRTKGEPTGFWRSLCPEASRVYFVCEAEPGNGGKIHGAGRNAER